MIQESYENSEFPADRGGGFVFSAEKSLFPGGNATIIRFGARDGMGLRDPHPTFGMRLLFVRSEGQFRPRSPEEGEQERCRPGHQLDHIRTQQFN